MEILGISGRKQSGKNTSFNLMLTLWLCQSHVVRGNAAITDQGKVWVEDLWGDKEMGGILDIDRDNHHMEAFRNEFVHPYIKDYSFADLLKRDVCIRLLGLSHEQCFGTDEQKNSLTHLLWEDMPCKQGETLYKTGLMTGREVMQYVGTEIFRKMYNDVWAGGTIKKIQAENPMFFAVITDCRFPNEVEAIQKAGGRVIRLTRNQNDKDVHESETVLDRENYEWSNFDKVIDNDDMTISECNGVLRQTLEDWGWLGSMDQEQTTQ